MKRSRSVSVVILAFTVIAGGALLLEHNGIFAGAFRTEILARVDDRDVARPGATAVLAQDVGLSDKTQAQ
ncbi:hypothetical protein ATY77_15990 [Rhizobium sp. R634]|uniref:hypothetical protein n=1 Tax=Rhizobium sp. R634 TaxID=1764274 RepID=UPI000B53663C|nr:hypothetical protein [Rhizobium sp. R634]OWV71060.1 hypothetical protein ATY77_15990 [Rhizobium sp. R634]